MDTAQLSLPFLRFLLSDSAMLALANGRRNFEARFVAGTCNTLQHTSNSIKSRQPPTPEKVNEKRID
jgi:hypothetical protein